MRAAAQTITTLSTCFHFLALLLLPLGHAVFCPASFATLLPTRSGFSNAPLPTRLLLPQALLAAASDGGGGGEGGSSSTNNGGGGGGGENLSAAGKDSGFSKALSVIQQGVKLYKELDSKDLDEENDNELQEETLDNDNDNKNNTNDNNTSAADADVPQPVQQMQQKLEAFQNRAKRTRIVLLRKVSTWAFETCTQGQSGDGKEDTIDRDAFYSGILLVHLHLAKYVGVAACNPPTRDQIDELFLLADSDASGDLTKQEFTNAVVVAMAPITSRIIVYYTVLALLPLLVARLISAFSYVMEHHIISNAPKHVYGKALAIMEWIINNMFSVVIFSIVLPFVFGKIDRASRRYARRRYQQPLWWLKLPKHLNNPQSWSTWFKQRFNAAQEGVQEVTEQSVATDKSSKKRQRRNKMKKLKDWQWTKWWPNRNWGKKA